jgi:hypothetical protein
LRSKYIISFFCKDRCEREGFLIGRGKIKALNKKLNLIGCYQNHAGINVGASYWEINKILETVNPHYFGTQYDIRHAMVEGGNSWVNGFKLLYPNIK